MDLLQDVGSAVRRLAGRRGFTLAALLTLALGIGANTAAEQAGVEARTLLQSSAGAMFGLSAGGTRRSVRGVDVDARVVPLLEEMVGEYRPAVDRGYDPANVITARIRNPDATFRPDVTPESMVELRAVARRFQVSLVEETVRLEVLPDVGRAVRGGRAGCPPPATHRSPPTTIQSDIDIVDDVTLDKQEQEIELERSAASTTGGRTPASWMKTNASRFWGVSLSLKYWF